MNGIKNAQADDLRPYFRIITGLININDSNQAIRLDMVLLSFLAVMEQTAQYWKPTEGMYSYIIHFFILRNASDHDADYYVCFVCYIYYYMFVMNSMYGTFNTYG